MQKTRAESTLKTAKFIFFGIFFQSTIFSFWGMQFFITQPGPTSAPWGVYVVFSLMAFLSFVYGVRFFQNYIKVKAHSFKEFSDKKLKETLLLIYAIHVLLIEFVAIIGIMISIFTQTRELIYPFYFLFLAGMWLSYPQMSWFASHFKNT